MNISSIVVQTNPNFTEGVVELLKSSDYCDYHFHDEKGRIIVTIEGEGVEEEIAQTRQNPEDGTRHRCGYVVCLQ